MLELTISPLFLKHYTSKTKIERFASILGSELTSGKGPKWDEVAALIRDVSELTEDDIRALRVLDSVFRHATFDGPETWIGISSAYTQEIPALNKAIVAAGFGGDEFFARAARLAGFGLAIEVSVSGKRTFEQDASYCFRPTGRGRKLTRLLSGNQD